MLRPLARRLATQGQYVCPQCAGRVYIKTQKRAKSSITNPRFQEQQSSILRILEERGFVNQIAGDRNALDQLLRTRRVGFYAGIDPTAPSLHLGHLLPLMVLFWLYHHGHSVVSLVGGGTARVGDPSGRLTSRQNYADSTHALNFATMYSQVGSIWDKAIRLGAQRFTSARSEGQYRLLNNGEWLDKLNVLDFLKMMGNGMRIGAMLGRDTVRNKMEKGDGMSFSEFTYPLLQAWDWWHMYANEDIPVQVQIGGSDQYGNIIAGIDAVKYMVAAQKETTAKLHAENMPMGLTVPLLTTSSGEKFGKSAGNAVWLDPSMTSSFDLYGFLLRSSDDDVERYLKLFTFLPLENIKSTMIEHAADPGKRKAQHLLASEVLELVHGPESAVRTREEHQALRNPSVATLSSSTADAAAQRAVLPRSLVLCEPLSRILYHAGVVATKSEGARLIAKGGVSVASVPTANAPSSTDRAESSTGTGEAGQLVWNRIEDQQQQLAQSFLINGKTLMFRVGKWKVKYVDVADDAEFDQKGLQAPGWEEWKAGRDSQRAN